MYALHNANTMCVCVCVFNVQILKSPISSTGNLLVDKKPMTRLRFGNDETVIWLLSCLFNFFSWLSNGWKKHCLSHCWSCRAHSDMFLRKDPTRKVGLLISLLVVTYLFTISTSLDRVPISLTFGYLALLLPHPSFSSFLLPSFNGRQYSKACDLSTGRDSPVKAIEPDYPSFNLDIWSGALSPLVNVVFGWSSFFGLSQPISFVDLAFLWFALPSASTCWVELMPIGRFAAFFSFD